MSKTRMSSGFFRMKPVGVDRELNVIEGVSVVTLGEAKGHGVHLDSEFLDEVTRLGADRKMGIKCRFGHPNMCNEALGTHLGWFKNFTRDGDQVRADLHISEAADHSPKGELGKYLLEMAESEENAFGTSIVFTPGNTYRKNSNGEKFQRNENVTEFGADVWYTDQTGHRLSEDEEGWLGQELYVECKELSACDAVDEPAANEGLFSADTYGQGEIAAQLTEFFDLHPQIADIALNNPDAVEVFRTFLSRYDANSKPNPQEKETEAMSTPEHTEAEEVVVEPTALSSQEVEAPAEIVEQPEAVEAPSFHSEFSRAVSDFGTEVAAKAFANGGGYDEARETHYSAIDAENKALKASTEGVEPVEFGEGEEKPNKIWKNL